MQHQASVNENDNSITERGNIPLTYSHLVSQFDTLLVSRLRGRLWTNMTSSTIRPQNGKYTAYFTVVREDHLACIENFVKCGRVVFEICQWTSRKTYRQAYRSISHRYRYGRRSKMMNPTFTGSTPFRTLIFSSTNSAHWQAA